MKKIPVFNAVPKFNPKILNFQKNKFILRIIKNLKKINFVQNEILTSMLPINLKTGNLLVRLKKLNKHRLTAFITVIQGMLYYFNIDTKKVEISIEQLADECGLSTISKSGNKSITRVSRLISEFMEPMGFIKCEKFKNKKNKILKKIVLTPLFFMLITTDKNMSKNLIFKQKFQILKNKHVHINFSKDIMKYNSNSEKLKFNNK